MVQAGSPSPNHGTGGEGEYILYPIYSPGGREYIGRACMKFRTRFGSANRKAHLHMGRLGSLGTPVAWLYPAAPPPRPVPGPFEGVLARGAITEDELIGARAHRPPQRSHMRQPLLALLVSGSLLAGAVLSCSAPSKRIIAPPAVIKGAEPVGTETCAGCHEEKARGYPYTAHGRYFFPEEEGEEAMGCETCHGQGSLHMEAGGDARYIIDPSETPGVCYRCHIQTRVAFNLEYHHPVREGRMTCTNCHDPHGEDIYKARGMRMGRERAVCSQCHKEQDRPRVFVHEALREGCTMCHRAHGSVNDKLLVENDSNLCLKCHAQISTPGSMVIGDFGHTNRLAQGTCWSAGCHTAVHGSDINPHLRY